VRAVGLSGRVLVSIWPVQVEEMTPGRAFNDASPAEALLPGLRAKACMAQRTNKLSPVSASTCRKVRLCVVPLVGKGVQPQYLYCFDDLGLEFVVRRFHLIAHLIAMEASEGVGQLRMSSVEFA